MPRNTYFTLSLSFSLKFQPYSSETIFLQSKRKSYLCKLSIWLIFKISGWKIEILYGWQNIQTRLDWWILLRLFIGSDSSMTFLSSLQYKKIYRMRKWQTCRHRQMSVCARRRSRRMSISFAFAFVLLFFKIALDETANSPHWFLSVIVFNFWCE